MGVLISIIIGVISGFLLAYNDAPSWAFVIAGLIVGLYAMNGD